MLVKVFLVGEELEDWKDERGRGRIIDRVRQLGAGDDIDQVSIFYGTQGQVLELAPSSHVKLAARLRELGLHELATLVDPKKQKDLVARQKYADQLQNLGLYFSPKEPMGEAPRR
jgi:hypothetical protein